MLYLHLFSYFFHFRLYSTSRISDIAVPRFFFSANEYILFLCMLLVVNDNSGAKIIY